MRSNRIASALCLFSVAASGCAHLLRHPVTPFPIGTPHTAPWNLNRELLMPETRRIVFVVELVRGHPPETAALDHLVAIASRHGEREAAWIPVGAPGAPRLVWDGDQELRAAVGLDPATSYVMVRYLGRGEGFGLSGGVAVAGRQVYKILVWQEAHRDLEFGWLTEARMEAQTLVHEYGHILGLPSYDHGFYPHFPSLQGGAHCVNPDCPLILPSLRSILYGLYRTGLTFRFLDDYCEQCRSNIAEAKRWWRAHDHFLQSVYPNG